MNKKASKIILFTTIGLMIAITIALGINNKEEDGLEYISGNKESLGNVNIVYQKKIGAYKTREVKLSKDETEVDEYAKARVLSLPFTDFYKEERDFYSSGYSRLNFNYEYENTIGYLQTEHEYLDDNKLSINFIVNEKNLETNKVDKYKIPINEKFDDLYTGTIGYPIKYNGELYALVVWQDESIGLLNEEIDSLSAGKESTISIYKIDLENKKSEVVDSQSFKAKDEYLKAGYPSFRYKNKYYIAKDTYEKISDEEIKTNRSFITYDLETQKFGIIDMNESLSIEEEYSTEYIEGDIAKIITSSKSNNKMQISVSILDLKLDKFTKENEIYTLELPKENYNYHINKLSNIDGKLYILVNASESLDESGGRDQLDKNYIYVVDEKSKSILYSGLIKDKGNEFINIDMVLE